MAVFIDARIPVVFSMQPGPQDAVLTLDAAPLHPAACACCIARHPHAAALDLLFLQRVRNEIAWFTRVVVAGDNPRLRAAVENDPVLSARFRLG